MLGCPACRKPLVRRLTDKGAMYVCPQCGGRAVAFAVLRKDAAARPFAQALWRKARYAVTRHGRGCPHCLRPMSIVQVPAPDGQLELDVCTRCQVVWFDPKEYRLLSRPAPAGAKAPAAEPSEASGRVERPAARRAQRAELAAEGPETLWQWLPAIFGLPVELRASRVRERPWLTWALAAVAVAVFVRLLAKAALAQAIVGWGFVPDEPFRRGGLTLITSFFLHAGVWHLLANMYFFLVFADNVEDHLGRGWFLVLLAAAHVVGMVVHAAFDPRSGVPCVGASAGISGVIAYYAVVFPQAKLGFVFWLWFFPFLFRLSAVAALVLYLGLQLLGAWAQLSGFTSVSALAHLGGLGVGIAAACIVRAARSRYAAAA